MNKILFGILAAGIIAAPAVFDKFSIAAKADATRAAEARVGQGVSTPVMVDTDESCRMVVTRERGLDGSVLVRRTQRCG